MGTFGLKWVSPACLNLPRWNGSRCLGGPISISLPYRLKCEEIVKTSHHSYLGVEIQDDGKWSKHVENCTKKANRALGFIRRQLGR